MMPHSLHRYIVINHDVLEYKTLNDGTLPKSIDAP